MLEDKHPLQIFAEGKFDEAVRNFRQSGGNTKDWTQLTVAMMRLQQVAQMVRDPSAADQETDKACLALTRFPSWESMISLRDEE